MLSQLLQGVAGRNKVDPQDIFTCDSKMLLMLLQRVSSKKMKNPVLARVAYARLILDRVKRERPSNWGAERDKVDKLIATSNEDLNLAERILNFTSEQELRLALTKEQRERYRRMNFETRSETATAKIVRRAIQERSLNFCLMPEGPDDDGGGGDDDKDGGSQKPREYD